MARPANIKKEEIVDIARPMFFENGIAATEMKDIAQACGIGRSSLYRYFDSKETLAMVVAKETLQQLTTALLGEAEEAPNGYLAVEKCLAAFVLTMKENVPIMRFLDDFDSYFYDGYPPGSAAARYRDKIDIPAAGLGPALVRGIQDGSISPIGSAEFTGMFLVNTLMGVAQRVLPRAGILRQEQGFAEEYLDETLRVLLFRLKGEAHPSKTGG